ncbi:hypothetical protein D6851_13655 [Altericroceibacterium spongiae]|uniref:Uncharacterized protein n=1 Tax=Altericroceibacterium spongiae TaxID=2320269 RepID=A0A420EED9_9SPHN|nr:hypothetical protein [Altericroceibacterium spongiae]RKF19059.1 hypothetical protein D6851_13655 [Altericroceibacterium spongiae]
MFAHIGSMAAALFCAGVALAPAQARNADRPHGGGEYRGGWEGAWDADGNFDGVWSGTYYRYDPEAEMERLPPPSPPVTKSELFHYPEPQRSAWLSECRHRLLNNRSLEGMVIDQASARAHIADRCERYLVSYEAAYSRPQYPLPESSASQSRVPRMRALRRREDRRIAAQDVTDSGTVTYQQ